MLHCEFFVSSALQKFRSKNYRNFCWNIFVEHTALSPPRISLIFQFSEILTEFIVGAGMLHQNIPTEM